MLYIVDVAYICLYNFTANSWILQKLEVVMSGMAIIMYIMHVNIYITSVHEYIKIIYLFVFYLIVLYRNSERTHFDFFSVCYVDQVIRFIYLFIRYFDFVTPWWDPRITKWGLGSQFQGTVPWKGLLLYYVLLLTLTFSLKSITKKLYGKCDDFIFLIDNFPFISCNIQATTARYCAKYCDIPDRTNLLT